MKPLSRDTTVDAQRKHYQLMRRLTPTQKLALTFELTDAGRKLILVIRAYGFDPRSEGF